MSKALDGVKILDFTHVQSGPTCTQLLAWFGADVIKVERPGGGDITRGQLRDIPDVDSLYFTMLNHNKRSITIDARNPQGKAVLEALMKTCDVMVENFAPGALDRMGFTWERIQQINPRMILASVKGFGPGPYEDCKVYENVAQCAGGSASTTGFDDGPPLVTGAQIGDSGTGLHLALGIVSALFQRVTTGRGQKVLCAMQDGVLNLCRVKLRDQQRLAHGPLTEYPQYPRRRIRRGGAARRQCVGWRPARLDSEMQGLGDRSQRLHLLHRPGAGVGSDLRRDRQAGMEDRPRLRQAARPSSSAEGDLRHHRALDNDQDEVRGHGHPEQVRHSVRSDPVDEGNRRGTVAARHRHSCGGGSPDARQVSDGRQSDQDVGQRLGSERSPLLGEHTDEILRDVLRFDEKRIAEIKASGALGGPMRAAAE